MILKKAKLYSRQNWLMTAFVMVAATLVASQSTVQFAYAQTANSNNQKDISSLMQSINSVLDKQMAGAKDANQESTGISASCTISPSVKSTATQQTADQTKTLQGMKDQAAKTTTSQDADKLAQQVNNYAATNQKVTATNLAIGNVCSQSAAVGELTSLVDQAEAKRDEAAKQCTDQAAQNGQTGQNGQNTTGGSTSGGNQDSVQKLNEIITSVTTIIVAVTAIIVAAQALIAAMQSGNSDPETTAALATALAGQLATNVPAIMQAISQIQSALNGGAEGGSCPEGSATPSPTPST